MSAGHVAVVGAGVSGTIQALHLLRAGVERVTLIEREREPGRGVAYGTRRPEHLLNVTAGRMIVYPDDPGHFARWFGGRGGEAEDYAPRMLFGDYVRELMAEAGDRLRIIQGEAIDVEVIDRFRCGLPTAAPSRPIRWCLRSAISVPPFRAGSTLRSWVTCSSRIPGSAESSTDSTTRTGFS